MRPHKITLHLLLSLYQVFILSSYKQKLIITWYDLPSEINLDKTHVCLCPTPSQIYQKIRKWHNFEDRKKPSKGGRGQQI